MPQLPWQELQEAARLAVRKSYCEGDPKFESLYANVCNAERFICYLLAEVVELGKRNLVMERRRS
jgi:hypothetical protein